MWNVCLGGGSRVGRVGVQRVLLNLHQTHELVGRRVPSFQPTTTLCCMQVRGWYAGGHSPRAACAHQSHCPLLLGVYPLLCHPPPPLPWQVVRKLHRPAQHARGSRSSLRAVHGPDARPDARHRVPGGWRDGRPGARLRVRGPTPRLLHGPLRHGVARGWGRRVRLRVCGLHHGREGGAEGGTSGGCSLVVWCFESASSVSPCSLLVYAGMKPALRMVQPVRCDCLARSVRCCCGGSCSCSCCVGAGC